MVTFDSSVKISYSIAEIQRETTAKDVAGLSGEMPEDVKSSRVTDLSKYIEDPILDS